jgi:hypothetical protein
MEKKFICPCGLVCTDCLFYKPEIYETAQKLRNTIKDSQLDVFLSSISESGSWKSISTHLNGKQSDFKEYFEVFSNFQDFMNILEGLTDLQCKSTCRETGGCSMGGKLHKCEAVKCVQSKGYEGCWECQDYKHCKKLNFVKKVYGDTINETFSTMNAEGNQAVNAYGNNYYAWQQKKEK